MISIPLSVFVLLYGLFLLGFLFFFFVNIYLLASTASVTTTSMTVAAIVVVFIVITLVITILLLGNTSWNASLPLFDSSIFNSSPSGF